MYRFCTTPDDGSYLHNLLYVDELDRDLSEVYVSPLLMTTEKPRVR